MTKPKRKAPKKQKDVPMGKTMIEAFQFIERNPGTCTRDISEYVYGRYDNCTKRNMYTCIKRLEARDLVLVKRGIYRNRYWVA